MVVHVVKWVWIFEMDVVGVVVVRPVDWSGRLSLPQVS